MKKLLNSATTQLAGWYLLILMSVSLIFSIIIFQIANAEIENRLQRFINQRGLLNQTSLLEQLDDTQKYMDTSTVSLLISLGYLNLVVLLAGGAGAYFLARQTIRPIEAAHDAQARFVSNASHQFRTPLAIMKAESELALAGKNNSKELRDTLSSNLEEINRLSNLSTMLLNLSKNKSLAKNSFSEINLSEVIQAEIQKRQLAERTKLEGATDLRVFGHEPAIREICAILIDNTTQHSPADSLITINLSENKTQATLRISNSGRGISKKQLSLIFEEFYRTDETSGYGLGLPLAKQLTKALDGQLSASSTPNKLTTFTLILPKN